MAFTGVEQSHHQSSLGSSRIGESGFLPIVSCAFPHPHPAPQSGPIGQMSSSFSLRPTEIPET